MCVCVKMLMDTLRDVREMKEEGSVTYTAESQVLGLVPREKAASQLCKETSV